MRAQMAHAAWGTAAEVCTASGCGKTLFALQEGVRHLMNGLVERIIIARPNVPAGEDLGFLPGSEANKLEPLLAPALDAITKVLGPGVWAQLQRSGLLELQSFAYMRGRTHDAAWIVADETQNASFTQLKMLCTRFGMGSKLCILGDPTQSDRGSNWAGSPLARFCEHLSSLHARGHAQMQDPWAIDADPEPQINPAEADGGQPDVSKIQAVRFTNEDCQRSATALASLRIFEQMEVAATGPKLSLGGGASVRGLQTAMRCDL
jgi:hypothetical protein